MSVGFQMPTFIYSAKSEPGKAVQGSVDASTRQEAVAKLAKLGYFPLSVEPEKGGAGQRAFFAFGKIISTKDIALLTRQLATLLESGVNIFTTLQILLGQASHKAFEAVLQEIMKNIKDGKPLSDSFCMFPQYFSPFYTALLHAGEVGGNLDKTLGRLADFLEREEDVKSSVRAALVYPFFIFLVSIATIAVLLGVVIPRLSSLFEDMGQLLPLPTKLLLGFSRHAASYGWVYGLALGIALLSLKRFFSTERGRHCRDALQLKLPGFGRMILKSELARLLRTLSLLLGSGIPIVSALNVSMETVQNRLLQAELRKIREDIAGGLSFSKALKASPFFPGLVVNIVAVGEEAGTLEKVLSRISEEYERDADAALKTFVHLLEPCVILVMGLLVGFIVLSMLLPIFQINLILA